MRVAVVSPYGFDRFGGVQDQVAGLVGWLRSRGHDAYAVAPGSSGPSGTVHVGRVVEVPANRSRAPVTLSPRAVGRVRQALVDADLVHVHEPLVPIVGLAAVMTSEAPVVGTFHADPGPMARRIYRHGRMAVGKVVRRLAAATAVSEVAAGPVRTLMDLEIVPNAVPTADTEVDRIEGRVVFVGRDEPRKGLDVLLEAWPAVRERHPRAELHVVGSSRDDGPEGVVFHGRVAPDVKRALVASSLVAVAPNLGGESFGIVVVEAMAAGCAVVASRIPAFEAVAGDAARLVAPGRAAALASAITELLGDRAEIDRLGVAARHASRRFAPDAAFGAYLDLYERVIDSR